MDLAEAEDLPGRAEPRGGLGHAEHDAGRLILGDGHGPLAAQRQQPGRAVLAHAGEQHADRLPASGGGDRAEQLVGRRPVQVRRVGVEDQAAAAGRDGPGRPHRHPGQAGGGSELEVGAGRCDVDDPRLGPVAVGGHHHRQGRHPLHPAHEPVDQLRVEVLDDQDGHGQPAKAGQDLGKGRRPAGRGGDGHRRGAVRVGGRRPAAAVRTR